MKNLELTISKSDSTIDITIEGSIVAVNAYDFSSSLLELAGQRSELRLDMTRVTDIGFTGLNGLKLTQSVLSERNAVFNIKLNKNSSIYQFMHSGGEFNLEIEQEGCLRKAA